MPRGSSRPPYSVFARFYDEIAGPLRAPSVRAREKVVGPLMRRIASACDLCCGTGTTALALAKQLAERRGAEQPPRVYGVDRSRAMLAVARAKFRAAGVSVQILQSDMRRFRLPEPVDLVTCEFDAINHLDRKQDLTAVTRAVERALNPGGWFFFDANTTKAFEELWSMNWIQQAPGFFMAAHGGYDAARDKGWTVWDWFVPESQARRWRRFTERFEEVAWSEAEISGALHAAGLRVAGTWDLTRFAGGAPWAKPGNRYFWLAQKASSGR